MPWPPPAGTSRGLFCDLLSVGADAPCLDIFISLLGAGFGKRRGGEGGGGGQRKEETQGPEASKAGPGRSWAGFLGPALRAPEARGGGGAGAARGGQWRAAQRRGRCRNTRPLTAKLPNSALVPAGSRSLAGQGPGRPSRAASEHGSRMRRLAPGRGLCRCHRRAAV